MRAIKYTASEGGLPLEVTAIAPPRRQPDREVLRLEPGAMHPIHETPRVILHAPGSDGRWVWDMDPADARRFARVLVRMADLAESREDSR